MSETLKKLLNDALSIDESIGAAEQTELPGAVGGQADRARHIFWMQSLANKFGPNAARILGVLNEIPGFLSGDFDESRRDLETNKMALMFADGEPDMDAIKQMVMNLAVDEEGNAAAANPLEIFRGQQRAKTPTEAIDRGVRLADTRTP